MFASRNPCPSTYTAVMIQMSNEKDPLFPLQPTHHEKYPHMIVVNGERGSFICLMVIRILPSVAHLHTATLLHMDDKDGAGYGLQSSSFYLFFCLSLEPGGGLLLTIKRF